MSRVCIAITLISLPVVATAQEPSVRRFPQNQTIDAQFPSAHEYIVEIWFDSANKRATFQSDVYDPSIRGDYDRQAWEGFRLKYNAPGSGRVSRKITVTTSKNSPLSEREQIQARIRKEWELFETPQTATVDVKPHASEEQTKGQTKGFTYDKDAPKNVGMAGTTWKNGRVTWKFDDERNWTDIAPNGAKFAGTYTLRGDSLTLSQPGVGHWYGTVSGNRLVVLESDYFLPQGGVSQKQNHRGDPDYVWTKAE
jgi:hypothetical protein